MKDQKNWLGIYHYYLRKPIKPPVVVEGETAEPIIETAEPPTIETAVPSEPVSEPLQGTAESTTWLDRIMKMFKRRAA